MSDLPLTPHSSVSAVIADFVGESGSAAERRGLRAALSHVDAELGTMPIRAVRTRHLTALLDELYDAGLSARREAGIVDALHSLFAFAVARRLVAADPTPRRAEPMPRSRVRTPAPPAMPAPPSTRTSTPTLTMVALGARVAIWTAWTITIVFAALLVALVLELA
jgi:hypothetical protein